MMSTDAESIAEQLKVPPTTVDEAEYQLDLIKLAKKQLNVELDYVMEQQRQKREEYTAQTRKGATRGDGVVRLISKEASDTIRHLQGTLDDYHRRGLAKDLQPLEAERAMIEAALVAPEAADTLEDAQQTVDDYRRRGLANDLEPLEDQRVAIEEELHQLELRELELEKWIEEEEVRIETEEKARKEAAGVAELAAEEDAAAAISQAQAEAELARAEAEKAKAEAEQAKAEAEKAQAEAEPASAGD